MTESLMLALTARGLRRADAHELLRRLTRDPGQGPPLAERAKADAGVRQFFDGPEIDRLVDPGAYVAAAAAKTDRIVARLDRALGR